ncbi:PhzF family phenazine biosynthesis protein [Aliifodinibius sp. S!AR15-10]|uniref:PhzF family phenazine biosynthesis protein n=1 Tax=Aliifodinibius sp. S!AR15-10 TaxID=2950437 RepID=UPI00285ACFAB|nr:PhzF family phenazine biosynthesis protein [Aliifodinibius sp. S!AR15-10]MDR8392504.1 PhzF family phenazine biosynthesis protein [Aliifodinibius sp. S!AR15-10]
MKLDLYQVDAFASKIFEGNPAAVCPLHSWLPDELMQQIAMENNLSETAFFVRKGDRYELRWFTPEVEVDMCGHATLASAYVLFNQLGYQKDAIFFDAKCGELTVKRDDDGLVMDFPASPADETSFPNGIEEMLGATPLECYQGMDYLFVFENEQQVKQLSPEFLKLKKLDTRGIIATAPSDEEEIDFVSRFFAPAVGINEDPVTGSAHTMLTPYWAERLGKNTLAARQISKRGGLVKCKLNGDRVELGGSAQTFMTGTIELPEQ